MNLSLLFLNRNYFRIYFGRLCSLLAAQALSSIMVGDLRFIASYDKHSKKSVNACSLRSSRKGTLWIAIFSYCTSILVVTSIRDYIHDSLTVLLTYVVFQGLVGRKLWFLIYLLGYILSCLTVSEGMDEYTSSAPSRPKFSMRSGLVHGLLWLMVEY